MKTTRPLIAVCLVLVLCAALFSACRSHKTSHAFVLDYITETLDLTEKQQADLKEIQAEIEAGLQALHGKKEARRDRVKAQILADRMDREVIKGLVTEQRDEMTRIIDLAVERLVGFHETLTPAQKEKLVQKIETFESWRHGCRS